MRATDPAAAMLALNPWLPSWAAGTSLWPLAGSSEEAVIVARRRQATAQRFAGGPGVWNGWANGMVSLVRAAAASPGVLRAWRELAAADFSGAVFEDEFDCTALMFPGAVNFAGANFTAIFQGTNFPDRADFSHCAFGREAFFENCEFSGPAVFAGATFNGEARFTYSRFHAAADFTNTRFRKAAWFRYGNFAGAARFSGATFARDVGLGSCSFSAESDFADVQFADTVKLQGHRVSRSDALRCGALRRQGDVRAGAIRRAREFRRHAVWCRNGFHQHQDRRSGDGGARSDRPTAPAHRLTALVTRRLCAPESPRSGCGPLTCINAN